MFGVVFILSVKLLIEVQWIKYFPWFTQSFSAFIGECSALGSQRTAWTLAGEKTAICFLNLPVTMTNTSLPVALEGLLHSPSETSTVISWNMRWTGYTTLVIRWDCRDRSAMGHAVSTCTTSKYRKKSPSEVRRDAHRAPMFYENTRKRNTEHWVRQQNTETDQMCELFHSPARSLTDDEDRHADMGDSLTEELSRGSECGSCNADCSQGQTVYTRRTDLDINSFHDTTLPETSGEEAALIRAAWEDRPVRPYLNSLDASARNVICQLLKVANLWWTRWC